METENNYPKAFLATGLIMAVLAALCYFIVFQTPLKQEDGTGGILVNYGTVDEGKGSDYMSTEEPSVAEKANHTKPNKITPAKPVEQKTQVDNSDKKIVTQTTEDAPVVTNSNKKSTTDVATEAAKPVAKPVVNQNALYKGKATNGTGEGDGTGNKPGNQGKPTGSTLTNNYNGTGSGNGGNLSMQNRNFISRPQVADDGHHTGKVVVDIRVDKAGNVIYARAGAKGTTISDNNLLQKCEDAVRNVKVNPLETAADVQPGTVVFVFKVN